MHKIASLLLVVCLLLTGCRGKPMPAETPDYSRPLPPGVSGLRRVTSPDEMPDFQAAFRGRDDGLSQAIARSLTWFDAPSSQRAFPMYGVTHAQARASVAAFDELLTTSTSAPAFERALLERFDVFTSYGWAGRGEVLFTGYYSPVFPASLTKTPEYSHALYRRPDALETDPLTGKVVTQLPTRAQLESSGMLAGGELVYLRSRLDAYLVHVQGSARLQLTDGRVMYVGYAGNNGHEYVSIGRAMVADGKLDPNRLSLPAIRSYFRAHPDELDDYIRRNDRFVFFQAYDDRKWPAGSLGVKVTPMRSIATDKAVFPRGGVTVIDVDMPLDAGAPTRVQRFMLDQDTGGAIRSAGRADLYIGIGDDAERVAGRQYAVGRLYYLFLKPALVVR